MRRRRLKRLVRVASVLLLLSIFAIGFIWLARGRPVNRSTHAAPRAALYPDPPGIVFHASMTPGRVQGVPIDAAWLERIHAEDHPGWATNFEGKVYHIGYHYVILPDGTVQKGRPDHCIGCHAPHFNTWLGICLIGCFDPSIRHHWKPSRPTVAQITALVALCERLMSEYHIPPERILQHRDTKLTWCPGRRFPYRRIMAQLREYAGGHLETRQPAALPLASDVPIAASAAGDGR